MYCFPALLLIVCFIACCCTRRVLLLLIPIFIVVDTSIKKQKFTQFSRTYVLYPWIVFYAFSVEYWSYWKTCIQSSIKVFREQNVHVRKKLIRNSNLQCPMLKKGPTKRIAGQMPDSNILVRLQVKLSSHWNPPQVCSAAHQPLWLTSRTLTCHTKNSVSQACESQWPMSSRTNWRKNLMHPLFSGEKYERV